MSNIALGPQLTDIDIPTSPTLGLPEGTKQAGQRVDFRDQAFDVTIETKGTRVAWSQAAVCPCVGSNDQTDQPDINCALCAKTSTPGLLYFRPAGYDSTIAAIGELNDLQRYIIDRDASPSVVVRAIAIGVQRNETATDRVGQWVDGTVNLTFRKNHKIGFYDRMVFLDSLLPFSEIVVSGAAGSPTPLRFPAVKCNFVRSETARYEEGTDFFVNQIGQLCFLSGRGPAANTKLSVHYVHYPSFIVVSHLNAIRDSLVIAKKQATKTPLGDPQQLPVRVTAQLEFLL